MKCLEEKLYLPDYRTIEWKQAVKKLCDRLDVKYATEYSVRFSSEQDVQVIVEYEEVDIDEILESLSLSDYLASSLVESTKHTTVGVESVVNEMKAYANREGISYEDLCTEVYDIIPTLTKMSYSTMEEVVVKHWTVYKSINSIDIKEMQPANETKE